DRDASSQLARLQGRCPHCRCRHLREAGRGQGRADAPPIAGESALTASSRRSRAVGRIFRCRPHRLSSEGRIMDLGLKGKRVLITGASQGIGEGLAEVFAEEGANLFLVARQEDRLKEISERLKKAHGITADYFTAAFTRRGDIERRSEERRVGIEVL